MTHNEVAAFLDDIFALEELHERQIELMQKPACKICGPAGDCWFCKPYLPRTQHGTE